MCLGLEHSQTCSVSTAGLASDRASWFIESLNLFNKAQVVASVCHTVGRIASLITSLWGGRRKKSILRREPTTLSRHYYNIIIYTGFRLNFVCLGFWTPLPPAAANPFFLSWRKLLILLFKKFRRSSFTIVQPILHAVPFVCVCLWLVWICACWRLHLESFGNRNSVKFDVCSSRTLENCSFFI